MIKTKSVYDSAEPSDGTRVLVTRFHPRKKGFRKGVGYDVWLRGLSPDKDLLKAHRQGNVTREQFSETYLKHLSAYEGKYASEKGGALCAVRALIDKGDNVTFLCYEPEDGRTFCHRHVLKDYLSGA